MATWGPSLLLQPLHLCCELLTPSPFISVGNQTVVCGGQAGGSEGCCGQTVGPPWTRVRKAPTRPKGGEGGQVPEVVTDSLFAVFFCLFVSFCFFKEVTI